MSIEQAHAMLTAPGTMLEVGEETIRGVKLKVWKNAPPTLNAIFELAAAFGPARSPGSGRRARHHRRIPRRRNHHGAQVDR